MLPIYIGAEGEENQGLCTGSENYWCVNKNADPADIQATLDFMEWVVTSDTGRDALANTMGFVTPFKTFEDGYQSQNPLVLAMMSTPKLVRHLYHGTSPQCLLKSGKTASAAHCLSMLRAPATGMLL